MHASALVIYYSIRMTHRIACMHFLYWFNRKSLLYIRLLYSFILLFKKKLHLQQFIRHEQWFAQFCSLWKPVEYRELEISTICTSDRYIYNEVKVRFTGQARSIAFESKGGAASPPQKKNLDRQKKLNKIKKKLKNLEKKNSWGRGCVVFLVTPISLLSSFFSLPFSIITCSQKSWGREQFHMHDILYFYLSI